MWLISSIFKKIRTYLFGSEYPDTIDRISEAYKSSKKIRFTGRREMKYNPLAEEEHW